MKNFSYFEPQTLKEALAILADHRRRGKIMGGGTDLVPQMKRGLTSPEVIIHLSKIPQLREIKESSGVLKIGAMVPLGVLERNSKIGSHYPGLKEALSHLAVPAIRNMGTIGGNLCLDTKCIYHDQAQTWQRALAPCFKRGGKRCYVVPSGRTCHASLAAETVPILIALQAKVKVVSSQGERTIPVEQLYTGNGIRPLKLSPEEMVREILLPRPGQGTRSAYSRYARRKAIDFALASAAVCLEKKGETCVDVRMVLGAVAPWPVRLTGVEGSLKGKKITEEIFQECARQAPEEALQISKSGRMDHFTRTMIGNLVYGALKKAWQAEG